VGGAALGALSLAGTASGGVPVGGAAPGVLSLGGALSGTVAVAGTGTGSLSIGGVCTGGVAVASTGSGTLSLSGAGVGGVPVGAYGTLRLQFPGLGFPTVTRALTTRTTTSAAVARQVTAVLTTRTTTRATSVPSILKRVDDTLPIFTATLTRDGVAFNLNDATMPVTGAVLQYRLRGATTWTTRTLVIPSSPTGRVTYTWASGEPAAAGIYEFTVRVTFDTGDVQSFPNGDGYETFQITAGST
jgi:hypothetical protein